MSGQTDGRTELMLKNPYVLQNPYVFIGTNWKKKKSKQQIFEGTTEMWERI